MVIEIAGIDVPRVTDWLVANIDGAEAPFRFDIIVGGRSNLTFTVTDANDQKYVLRRPPTGSVLATAHDMEREHRIISAIGQTNVPVPETLGVCRDIEVTGAPFYVMSHVAGVVLDSQERAEEHTTPEQRRVASEHLIDVLADLHSVDIDAIGLGDLARREGYVERQVKRWTTQWEKSKTRDLPAVDEVARRLAASLPTQVGVSIAHGDYRFGNVLIDGDRVTGVLDWELCTLGDPLADVGYLGVYWTDPGTDEGRHNDPSGLDGFPTYAAILERYANRTGRDLSNINYYRAFSSWRLAVISEGVFARYSQGAMGDQDVDQETLDNFREGPELLSAAALELLDKN